MTNNDTRTLKIVVTGDSAQGQRALRATAEQAEVTEQKVGRLRRAFDDLGPTVIAGLAGVGVIGAFRATVGAATDLNETISKGNTIFGQNAGAIRQWAEDAEQSMGLSTRAAIDGAAVFGNFFQQVGISDQAAAGMSKRLVELSADFASFHNAEPAQVMDALAAATRGEYDALQRFVPTANAANIEAQAMADTGKDTAKSLTLAEKATALFNLVIKDGGSAVGDFQRTSESAANQQRILKARLEETGATIGNFLLPAYEGLLGAINNVGPLYAAGAALSLVFGRQINDAVSTAATATGQWYTAQQKAAESARQGGTRYARLTTALNVTKTAAVGAGNALKAVGAAAGGPVGIGIAAATLGIGYFTSKAAENKARNEQLETSLVAVGQAYKQVGTLSDESVQTLIQQDELLRKLVLDTESYGVSTEDLVQALSGNERAQARVNEQLAEYERQQRVLLGEMAGTVEHKYVAQAEKANAVANEQERLNRVFGKVNESTALNARITEASTKATTKAEKKSSEYAEALEVVYDTTKTAEDRTNALRRAFDALYGAAINQDEATTEYQESLDKMTASLKENGKTLSRSTEKGRENRKAIIDRLEASRRMYEADIAAKVPIDKATAAHQRRTNQLIREADKSDLNRSAVRKLVDMYGKVPTDVKTQITVNGYDVASKKLTELAVYQQALKSGKTTAQALIEQKHFRLRNFAGGGEIKAPGTTTSDDGLVRVSNKEWVIQAEAAQKYGPAIMDDINKGRINKQALLRAKELPAYAGGGAVRWPFPVNVRSVWAPSKDSIRKRFGFVPGHLNPWGGPELGGGPVDSGVWKHILALVRSSGIPYQFGNAFRTTDNLWHSKGRAIDFMGYNQDRLAQFFMDRKSSVRELIHTTNKGGYYITNGVRQQSMGIQDGLHRNHLHVAMDRGGVIPPKSTVTVSNATSDTEFALTRDKLHEVAGVTIHGDVKIYVQAASDPRETAQMIRDELVKLKKRNGGKTGL